MERVHRAAISDQNDNSPTSPRFYICVIAPYGPFWPCIKKNQRWPTECPTTLLAIVHVYNSDYDDYCWVGRCACMTGPLVRVSAWCRTPAPPWGTAASSTRCPSARPTTRGARPSVFAGEWHYKKNDFSHWLNLPTDFSPWLNLAADFSHWLNFTSDFSHWLNLATDLSH